MTWYHVDLLSIDISTNPLTGAVWAIGGVGIVTVSRNVLVDVVLVVLSKPQLTPSLEHTSIFF